MKIRTCLRYPGGKFYGIKRIKPFYSIPHDEYREPFVGGASVFLDKELVNTNWLNDKDPELMIFYNVIVNKSKSEQLFKLLVNEKANKIRYQKVKNFIPRNDIETAFKYFYLNRTSFSGIMNKPRWGYLIGSSVTPDRWAERIKPVAEKFRQAKLTNLDFREVIQAKTSSKKVLMYVDPPYFHASKSIYKHEFLEKDHYDLRDLLRNTSYKFILSYEDSAEVKKMYDWAFINNIKFRYFMSEGRRDNGQELIITNYKVANQ